MRNPILRPELFNQLNYNDFQTLDEFNRDLYNLYKIKTYDVQHHNDCHHPISHHPLVVTSFSLRKFYLHKRIHHAAANLRFSTGLKGHSILVPSYFAVNYIDEANNGNPHAFRDALAYTGVNYSLDTLLLSLSSGAFIPIKASEIFADYQNKFAVYNWIDCEIDQTLMRQELNSNDFVSFFVDLNRLSILLHGKIILLGMDAVGCISLELREHLCSSVISLADNLNLKQCGFTLSSPIPYRTPNRTPKLANETVQEDRKKDEDKENDINNDHASSRNLDTHEKDKIYHAESDLPTIDASSLPASEFIRSEGEIIIAKNVDMVEPEVITNPKATEDKVVMMYREWKQQQIKNKVKQPFITDVKIGMVGGSVGVIATLYTGGTIAIAPTAGGAMVSVSASLGAGFLKAIVSAGGVGLGVAAVIYTCQRVYNHHLNRRARHLRHDLQRANNEYTQLNQLTAKINELPTSNIEQIERRIKQCDEAISYIDGRINKQNKRTSYSLKHGVIENANAHAKITIAYSVTKEELLKHREALRLEKVKYNFTIANSEKSDGELIACLDQITSIPVLNTDHIAQIDGLRQIAISRVKMHLVAGRGQKAIELLAKLNEKNYFAPGDFQEMSFNDAGGYIREDTAADIRIINEKVASINKAISEGKNPMELLEDLKSFLVDGHVRKNWRDRPESRNKTNKKKNNGKYVSNQKLRHREACFDKFMKALEEAISSYKNGNEPSTLDLEEFTSHVKEFANKTVFETLDYWLEIENEHKRNKTEPSEQDLIVKTFIEMNAINSVLSLAQNGDGDKAKALIDKTKKTFPEGEYDYTDSHEAIDQIVQKTEEYKNDEKGRINYWLDVLKEQNSSEADETDEAEAEAEAEEEEDNNKTKVSDVLMAMQAESVVKQEINEMRDSGDYEGARKLLRERAEVSPEHSQNLDKELDAVDKMESRDGSSLKEYFDELRRIKEENLKNKTDNKSEVNIYDEEALISKIKSIARDMKKKGLHGNVAKALSELNQIEKDLNLSIAIKDSYNLHIGQISSVYSGIFQDMLIKYIDTLESSSQRNCLKILNEAWIMSQSLGVNFSVLAVQGTYHIWESDTATFIRHLANIKNSFFDISSIDGFFNTSSMAVNVSLQIVRLYEYHNKDKLSLSLENTLNRIIYTGWYAQQGTSLVSTLWHLRNIVYDSKGMLDIFSNAYSYAPIGIMLDKTIAGGYYLYRNKWCSQGEIPEEIDHYRKEIWTKSSAEAVKSAAFLFTISTCWWSGILAPASVLLLCGAKEFLFYDQINKEAASKAIAAAINNIAYYQKEIDGLKESKEKNPSKFSELDEVLLNSYENKTNNSFFNMENLLDKYCKGLQYNSVDNDAINHARLMLYQRRVYQALKEGNFDTVEKLTLLNEKKNVINQDYQFPPYLVYSAILSFRFQMIMKSRLLDFHQEYNRYVKSIDNSVPKSWHERYDEEHYLPELKKIVVLARQHFIIAALNSKNVESKHEYLEEVKKNYMHVGAWWHGLTDEDLFLAGAAYHDLNDQENSELFINKISDIEALLREKKEEEYTDKAISVLADIDPDMQQALLASDSREELAISDIQLKRNALELFHTNYELYKETMEKKNFEGKAYVRAYALSQDDDPNDFQILNLLSEETDRDFCYWQLLFNTLTHIQSGIEFCLKSMNHPEVHILFIGFRKLCIDKMKESHLEYAYKKNLDEIDFYLQIHLKDFIREKFTDMPESLLEIEYDDLIQKGHKYLRGEEELSFYQKIYQAISSVAYKIPFESSLKECMPCMIPHEETSVFHIFGLTLKSSVDLLKGHVQNSNYISKTVWGDQQRIDVIEIILKDLESKEKKQYGRSSDDSKENINRILNYINNLSNLEPESFYNEGGCSFLDAIALLKEKNLKVYHCDKNGDIQIMSQYMNNEMYDALHILYIANLGIYVHLKEVYSVIEEILDQTEQIEPPTSSEAKSSALQQGGFFSKDRDQSKDEVPCVIKEILNQIEQIEPPASSEAEPSALQQGGFFSRDRDQSKDIAFSETISMDAMVRDAEQLSILENRIKDLEKLELQGALNESNRSELEKLKNTVTRTYQDYKGNTPAPNQSRKNLPIMPKKTLNQLRIG